MVHRLALDGSFLQGRIVGYAWIDQSYSGGRRVLKLWRDRMRSVLVLGSDFH